MKSIKVKLITSVAIVVVLSVMLSNIMTSVMLSESYLDEVKLKHANLAKAVATNVQAFIAKAYYITEQLAFTPSIMAFDPQTPALIAADTKARNDFIELVFIQDETGMQTARSNGNLGDRSTRWWFKKIIADKQPFVSKSYYSLSTNLAVSSIFIPMFAPDNSMKGIMGIDIKLDALQKVVEQFSNDSLYMFVIDGEGTVVAHPDKRKVTELYNFVSLEKTILKTDGSGNVLTDANGNQITENRRVEAAVEVSEMAKRALSGASGFMAYTNFDGEDVYSNYSSIELPGSSDSWAVITVERVDDAQLLKRRTNFITNTFSIISIILTIVVIFYIATRVMQRIFDVTLSLKELSKGQGDLTRRIPVKQEDEVGVLSKLFNVFMQKLQLIIQEVKANSTSVAVSSEALSNSTREISHSIDNQARQIANVATATEEIKFSSQGVRESAQNGVDIINSTQAEVLEGNSQLQRVVDEMQLISKDVSVLAVTIKELSGFSNSIGEILNSIHDIASQTNLLALNAAIEAARAGEQGRGFSVVADEVRKLAEVTQASVQEVETIVTSLQSGCDKAAKDMGEASQRVEKGESLVSESSSQFKNIVASFENLSEVNHSIQLVVEEQVAALQEINDNIHSISSEADHRASSLVEVSNTISELKTDANNLNASVNKFKVD